MKVETIMTQNVVALQPGDTLQVALEQMQEKRIRHIPVVSKKGEFMGLISHRDLLAASSSFLGDPISKKRPNILAVTPIEKVMHKRVRTTTPDADLREVAIQMSKNKWGCLPVLRGKVLAGIVTATDFLKLSINLLSLHEQLNKQLGQCRVTLSEVRK